MQHPDIANAERVEEEYIRAIEGESAENLFVEIHPSFAARSGTVATAHDCKEHELRPDPDIQMVIVDPYLAFCGNYALNSHPGAVFRRNTTNFSIQNGSAVCNLQCVNYHDASFSLRPIPIQTSNLYRKSRIQCQGALEFCASFSNLIIRSILPPQKEFQS